MGRLVVFCSVYEMDVADAPELGVVLGGGLAPDGGPLPSTKARAHRAAQLARERPELVLICSGDRQLEAAAGTPSEAALINAMGDGFDTEKQKPAITEAALAFNDLLPIVPIWERYGNNPVNETKRVAPWPADSDPVFKNGGGDSFVSILIYNGTLHGI